MGMLQGAPHPPTNGLQRSVTAGNLACCLGDQWLCAPAQMRESVETQGKKRFTEISAITGVWRQYRSLN